MLCKFTNFTNYNIMKRIPLLFIVIILYDVISVSGQGWYCFNLIDKNCYKYGADYQCGSNNFTFYNKCEFGQGHCKDPNIHLLHSGECYYNSHTYNLTHGEELALQFVCQDLSSHPCPDEIDFICASDGITYKNMCDYEIRRCMHQDMTISHKGPCNTNTFG